jgi:nucleotide-binding universal stress UspA family protein
LGLQARVGYADQGYAMNKQIDSSQGRTDRVLLCVLDDTEELHIALDYASIRSKRTGARVGLLFVMGQADSFQHWASVGDLMREEARADAERRLLQAAARVKRLSGLTPLLYIREGQRGEEVVKQIEEDSNIAFLILAANTGKEGPGPLITEITGKAIGRLHIPLVIVPGNMSEEEVQSFA